MYALARQFWRPVALDLEKIQGGRPRPSNPDVYIGKSVLAPSPVTLDLEKILVDCSVVGLPAPVQQCASHGLGQNVYISGLVIFGLGEHTTPRATY